jgi:hypothetical protein
MFLTAPGHWPSMKEEDISRGGCPVVDIASKIRVAVSHNDVLFIAAKQINQVYKDLFYGFPV